MISAGLWSVSWSRSWSVDIYWSASLAAMIIAGWLRYNETITQLFRLSCDIILGGKDENVHLEDDEEILSMWAKLAPGPHDRQKKMRTSDQWVTRCGQGNKHFSKGVEEKDEF